MITISREIKKTLFRAFTFCPALILALFFWQTVYAQENCYSYAEINAGGATWLQVVGSDDGQDTNQTPSAENIPTVTPCNSVIVSGGGFGCLGHPTVFICTDEGGCTVIPHYFPEEYGDTNVWYYDVSNPKGQEGSVTFKATSTPLECPSGSESTVTATIHAAKGDSGCGCGGGGGGGGGGSAGSGSASNDSINFKVWLGLGLRGADPGSLQIYSELPSTNLCRPSNLTLTYLDEPGVTRITNIDGIAQVMAPQCLIVVSNIDNYDYALQVYDATNVTGYSSGAYTYSGSAIVTWLVQNPDGASSSNRLWITEEHSGEVARIFKYSYNSSGGWDLLEPDGITKITTWKTGSGSITNEFREIFSGTQLVTHSEKTYQFIPAFYGSVILKDVEGTGAVAQATSYTYYNSDPTNGSATNMLQRIDYPDGRWDYYIYDDSGRVVTNYESYLNNTTPAAGTVPDPAVIGCKVITYAFNGNTINPWTPYLTSVQLPVADGTSWDLKEVSRKLFFSNYDIDEYGNSLLTTYTYQCTRPGADRSDSGNITEVIQNYGQDLSSTTSPNPTNQFRYGLPRSDSHPDGTVTIYDYFQNPDGSLISSNRTGVINNIYGYWGSPGDITNIIDGTETVQVQDPLGRIISSTSRDIVSGLTLTSLNYTYLDNTVSGRDYSVVDLAGRTNTFIYDCCGLESITDPDGVVTGYGYDLMKRPILTTIYHGSFGVTTTRTLDGAGHVLVIQRTDTNGLTTTLSQKQYDILGRVIEQTNALGGIITTTYSPTNSPIITTNIDPDGGTEIETYYQDGQLQSTSGTGKHGSAYGYGMDTDVNGNACTYSVATNLDNSGHLTSEWIKTYSDMAGRTTEVLYADGHYSQSFYNWCSQLIKKIDPDGVTTLYQYDDKAEMAYQAIDMDQNGNIDFDGSDRITQTTNDVITDYGITVQRTRNYIWLDGQSTGTLVSSTETSADDLNTWQTQYRDAGIAVTNHSQTVPGMFRTMTNAMPDGSYTVSGYSYGQLTSSTRYDSTGTQIGGTTYGYDAQGRQNTMTDARNGTTTLTFNNADLVTTNTTPNPGGSSPENTITLYDNMQRAYSVIQPDGTSVSSVYLLTGELGLQYGSRTYPVGYSYDYAGRMQTMTNWSGFNTLAGARATTWNYDSQRGWLTSKAYPDGHGPAYTYTPAGRLATRVWVRGITTTYSYDSAGIQTNISYSDGVTPNVGYAYDRLGRQTNVVWNGITDTMTYNLANQLLGEAFVGGSLAGLAITNGYDTDLRRTNLTALSSGLLSRTTYGYDAASRLQTVSDGTNNATYSYLANSPLVSQLVFKQNGTTRMTTTKTYDYLNRLTQISSAPNTANVLPITFNYNYNPANQRTKNTLADGSYWSYGYDSLGQVTNACKYFADGTPVAGQQFDYTFDTIGNRTQTMAGGDATGANLRVANYAANNLNQITNRDVPAYVDVMGASILTNTVTVNGLTAYRKGEYFRQQLAANNGSSALWTNIIVSGGQSVTGNVYVAQSPEKFKYDADGNLTNDGRWAYVWDGENRLIQMTVNTNVGPQYQLTFAYDAQGRRIQKLVATNGVAMYTNRFLYDGWNLIVTLASSSQLQSAYMWGSDLSGSMQGAGGVGGLLETSYYGTTTTNCFPAFDGNGNVAALINAADGAVAANYEYGAFGEPTRMTGTMAKANQFRFSTKFQDDESDLLYYGYRYYKSSTGTWPNRDPLEERGGLNLYLFISNNSTCLYDILGLKQRVLWIWSHNRESEYSIAIIPLGKVLELKEAEEMILKSIENGETISGLVGRETSSLQLWEDVDNCEKLCFTVTQYTIDETELGFKCDPLPEITITVKFHYDINYEYGVDCKGKKNIIIYPNLLDIIP